MSDPLSEYLLADHQRLDGLLKCAIDGDFDAFERFRAGLLRHIGLEEKILLPAARKQGLAVQPELRLEHAALASLLVPTPDRALAQEIQALLERHNPREEGPSGLYASCAALLDGAALVERMRAVAEPPLAKHFDGPGTFRTADAALAAMKARL